MKNLKYIFLICNLQLATCNLFAQPSLEWAHRYPDTNTFQAGANAMALDDTVNVYITGYTENNNPVQSGYCTIKYSPSGSRLWVANYYSNNTGGRYAYAIALDKFSNVYVTGFSYENGDLLDYCTVKYNSNGVQQWVKTYDGPVHGEDEAQKIVVDNAGNIYVSGYSRIAGTFVITTIKYSPLGDVLWTRSYGAGVPVPSVNGIAVDDSCNIYIACAYNSALIIKYDSSGTQIWAQLYGNGVALANSIAIDKFHNVYIAGLYVNSNNKYDFLTIKYASSGIQQWLKLFSIDSTQSVNIAFSIALDDTGNVYAGGSTSLNASSPFNLCTLKYTNSGSLIWAQIDTSTLEAQYGIHLSIDKNSNVYVTGSQRLPQPNIAGIRLIKYDSSGRKQWSALYSSVGDKPYDIKLDNYNNIYITGRGGYGGRMETLKYSQPVGITGNNNHIPKNFSLSQNYPNPFNPSTKIKFEAPLNKGGNRGLSVKLTIYDILGKEIITLVNQHLKAGAYEVTWNAENYPSGVYFYKMVVGDNTNNGSYSETRKMIILK